MATEFKVPDLGENVDEGDIVSVMVKEGDEIQAEQSVMEIETGKAVVELPCPIAGRITKVHVQKGSKVKVGDPLLTLEGTDGQAESKADTKAPAKENGQQKKSEPQAEASNEQAAEPRNRRRARAKEAGHHRQEGRGKAQARAPAGCREHVGRSRTHRKDTAGRPRHTPLGARVGRRPGGRRRQRPARPHYRRRRQSRRARKRRRPPQCRGLARRRDSCRKAPTRRIPGEWSACRRCRPSAKRSPATWCNRGPRFPHVTNFDDADITELERIRKGGLADYVGTEIKLTMMAFVMKAVAQSLKLHPLLNCSIDMENEQIIYKHYVNIGVAVDTERGLVVPVVRDVDRLSIPAIAQSLTNVAEMARNATFKLADIKGGTFTISNMGAVGGVGSTPIINPPEVAVLLIGRSRKLPVVVEGDKIEVRLMMPLSLSYDHRIVDGGTAARFLNEVINYLKVPGRLLLAP